MDQPSDLIPKGSWGSDAARLLYSGYTEKGKPPSAAQLLAEKYNLGHGVHSVISLQEWSSIIQTGLIDKDWLNEELAGSLEMSGPDSWPSWKRLWHIHSWDFSDGSVDQFYEDVKDITQSLSDGGYHDPLEFMQVVGVILHLSRNGLVKGTPADWVEQLKSFADRDVVPHLDETRFKSTQSSFDSGYDGLGYIENDSSEFKAVLEHLKMKADQWRLEWLDDAMWKEALHCPSMDLYEFLGDFTVINGKGKQRYVHKPMLPKIPPEAFVKTWTSLPRDKERSLLGALKSRYSHDKELLVAEAGWWRDVSAVIIKAAQSEPVEPRAMQIRNLAKHIGSLILAQSAPEEEVSMEQSTATQCRRPQQTVDEDDFSTDQENEPCMASKSDDSTDG